MNRNRFAVLALAATVAVAVVAVPFGGPAAASQTEKGSACPNNAVCVYADPGGLGQRVVLKEFGVSNKLAKRMNNEASSAINIADGAIFFYDKRNAEGDRVCMAPNDKGNLSTFGFEDRASSSKLTHRNHCPV